MKNALDFIKSKDDFLILTHINPDGDALGSAFSLAAGLRLFGKKATVALLSTVPFKYDFSEFDTLFVQLNQLDSSAYKNVISVDCADLRRLGDAKDFFETRDSLNIDHHISNDGYADVNYIENCAATGEIIYTLLCALGVQFDKAVRLGIYMAIAADTGNLSFSNTTARSFNICAKLVDDGLNIPYAAGRIFNTRSYGATKLIATYIDHLKLFYNDTVSLSYITLKNLEDCNTAPEDCETLINYGKDIDTVEVAIFIRELKKDVYKISLRSKNYVDVAQLAANFDGGGHMRAAGFKIEDTYKNIEKLILDTVKEYLR